MTPWTILLLVLVLVVILVWIVLGLLARNRSIISRMSDIPYEMGQIYRYPNRPHEPDSRVIILEVATHEAFSTVIHIAVTNVHIVAPRSPNGSLSHISHLPLSLEAMNASGLQLE